jgi:hypothetical protein
VIGIPPEDDPQMAPMKTVLGIQFPNLLTVLRLAVAMECKVTELVRVFDKTDHPSMLPK